MIDIWYRKALEDLFKALVQIDPVQQIREVNNGQNFDFRPPTIEGYAYLAKTQSTVILARFKNQELMVKRGSLFTSNVLKDLKSMEKNKPITFHVTELSFLMESELYPAFRRGPKQLSETSDMGRS